MNLPKEINLLERDIKLKIPNLTGKTNHDLAKKEERWLRIHHLSPDFTP
ncbi:MAG: hypothetical protein HY200_03435 [Nitrospirae bacterium]|nr:hypothetical protein [Nitrospirota bacterium]